MDNDTPAHVSSRAHRKITTFACSTLVNVLFSVSGFAQSDTVSRADTAATLAAVRATDVMRVYGGNRTADAPGTVPPNLTFPETFRETIDSMLRRSPTFRRQCVRIANASGLTVQIGSLNPYGPGTARARTTIARTADGQVVAKVEIRPLDDTAELIAHEIEHVIEQLDGVDLRVQSSRPGTGVQSCVDGSFETIRAKRVGTLVAQETRLRLGQSTIAKVGR